VNPNVAKCLVVSKVLVADGMMMDEERTFLAQLMDKLGLTEDERKRVIELKGLDDADAIVRTLPVEERRELVTMLVDAASADGKLSPHELGVVKKLSAALGIA
jgi:uncharacterized tellurite resistance protein B-like protein